MSATEFLKEMYEMFQTDVMEEVAKLYEKKGGVSVQQVACVFEKHAHRNGLTLDVQYDEDTRELTVSAKYPGILKCISTCLVFEETEEAK